MSMWMRKVKYSVVQSSEYLSNADGNVFLAKKQREADIIMNDINRMIEDGMDESFKQSLKERGIL